MKIYLVIVVFLIILLYIMKKTADSGGCVANTKPQKTKQGDISYERTCEKFIGEECIIYTITSNDGSVHGIIKEIDDGGMIIRKNSGELEIINLDFVTRIREYPRKKTARKRHRTGLGINIKSGNALCSLHLGLSRWWSFKHQTIIMYREFKVHVRDNCWYLYFFINKCAIQKVIQM